MERVSGTPLREDAEDDANEDETNDVDERLAPGIDGVEKGTDGGCCCCCCCCCCGGW